MPFINNLKSVNAPLLPAKASSAAAIVLYPIIFLLCTAQFAFAGEPWAFQFSLKSQLSGKPMILPNALFIDREANRYYVADSGNNRLLSFDQDGNLLKVFSADNQLLHPMDMVKDANGLIWVTEKKEGGTLTSINLADKKITPHSISQDGKTIIPGRMEIYNGHIFVLDKVSGELFELDDKLQVKTHFICRDCSYGLIDFKLFNGTIYGLSLLSQQLFRFDLQGNIIDSINLADHTTYPYSFDIDSSGRIYVLDRHRKNIAVFAPDGQFKYRFLTEGQNSGQIYHPVEIRFDFMNRLCVVDEGNSRVDIFIRQ